MPKVKSLSQVWEQIAITSEQHRRRTSEGTIEAMSKLKRCVCPCGCKRVVGLYLEGTLCGRCLTKRHKVGSLMALKENP